MSRENQESLREFQSGGCVAACSLLIDIAPAGMGRKILEIALKSGLTRAVVDGNDCIVINSYPDVVKYWDI